MQANHTVSRLRRGLSRTIAVSALVTSALGFPGVAVAGLGDLACVNESSGVLRAVEDASECRKNEEVIPLSVPGPPGPPGSGFRVVDGAGRDLGAFLSIDSFNGSILVQHDQLGVHLWLNRFDGTLTNSNRSLLYEQFNCKGQPWATAADVGRLQGPLVDTEQYFVVAEEAVEGLEFVSRRQIFGSCENRVVQSQLSGFYARLVEIALDEVGYEFPVAMPLRIRSENKE